MSDRAAEIRAEAIERLARAEYEKDLALFTVHNRLPWDTMPEASRIEYRGFVEHLVDALGDLLPVGIEESLAGGFRPGIHTWSDIENQSYPPVRKVRRYVTEWRDAE